MLIRGRGKQESGLLFTKPSDVVAADFDGRMLREKPDLLRVEVPQRGHTPMLDEPVSVAAIDEFLARTP